MVHYTAITCSFFSSIRVTFATFATLPFSIHLRSSDLKIAHFVNSTLQNEEKE